MTRADAAGHPIGNPLDTPPAPAPETTLLGPGCGHHCWARRYDGKPKPIISHCEGCHDGQHP